MISWGSTSTCVANLCLALADVDFADTLDAVDILAFARNSGAILGLGGPSGSESLDMDITDTSNKWLRCGDEDEVFVASLLGGWRIGDGETGLSENSSPSLDDMTDTGDFGLVLPCLRGDVCLCDLRGDFCNGLSRLVSTGDRLRLDNRFAYGRRMPALSALVNPTEVGLSSCTSSLSKDMGKGAGTKDCLSFDESDVLGPMDDGREVFVREGSLTRKQTIEQGRIQCQYRMHGPSRTAWTISVWM